MRILLIIIAVIVGFFAKDIFGEDFHVNMVMDQYKEDKLMATIFELHPESEKELYDKLLAADKNGRMYEESLIITGEMITKYNDHYMPLASKENVYEINKLDLDILAAFKNSGDYKNCAAYSTGIIDQEDLPTDLSKRLDDTLVAIFRQGHSNPAPVEEYDLDYLDAKFLEVFVANGRTEEDFAKFADLSKISDNEICVLMYDYYTAVVDMGPEVGSDYTKSLY